MAENFAYGIRWNIKTVLTFVTVTSVLHDIAREDIPVPSLPPSTRLLFSER